VGNVRQRKSIEDLTHLRDSVADIIRRLGVLEEEVFGGSFLVPPTPAPRTRPGPKPKVGDTELFGRRNDYVLGIEHIWPAPQMPIAASRQEQFALCSVQLFEFISSDRFVREPSKRTVVSVLDWKTPQCFQAAARLPTRQIANALAGVPELAWRRSLDRCITQPCEWHVRSPTEDYYRRAYNLS
jgi:hypothetical protein